MLSDRFQWFYEAQIAIPACNARECDRMGRGILEYVYGTWWRCRDCRRWWSVL